MGDDRKRHAPPLVTADGRLDRAAVEDAVRDMIDRECARVGDPGASIPGADPSDAHGWHANLGARHPREPGMPLFDPEAWRFFRPIDLGWLGDDLVVGFAWDELGTPNLHYLTRTGFMTVDRELEPFTLALNVRMNMRYLLAPTVGAATSTASWRERCARLWLRADQVFVGPGLPDQHRADAGWALPWLSLTNPPWPHPHEDQPPVPNQEVLGPSVPEGSA